MRVFLHFLPNMANDAEKKTKQRTQVATRNVLIANVSLLVLFFLVRLLLKPMPLERREWAALLLTLVTQAGASYLYVGAAGEGTVNEGALDVLGLALAALLFAAFDRRGWIFALLAPVVAGLFAFSGASAAFGSMKGLAQKMALGQAQEIAAKVDVNGGVARGGGKGGPARRR